MCPPGRAESNEPNEPNEPYGAGEGKSPVWNVYDMAREFRTLVKLLGVGVRDCQIRMCDEKLFERVA